MATTTDMPDLVEFCARYTAAWNDHDPAAMADLVTDDIVWEDPALPAPARGVAAVQAFMRTAGSASRTCTSTSPTTRTAPPTAPTWRGAGGCAAR